MTTKDKLIENLYHIAGDYVRVSQPSEEKIEEYKKLYGGDFPAFQKQEKIRLNAEIDHIYNQLKNIRE
jgi:hypothetical protein